MPLFDPTKLREVKVSRTGQSVRPTKAQHGTTLLIENEFVHGIADADALQPKVSVEGEKCWSWGLIHLRNMEFGTCWRTPAGAVPPNAKHVDRLQVLGNPRQTAPMNVTLEGVRFSSRGDPMTPAGSTRGETGLFQEAEFGQLVLCDVQIVDPSLPPIKLTLRTPQSRCAGVLIDDCPGLRLHVTALKAAQCGRIFVRGNSPGVSIATDVGDGMPLDIVREDTLAFRLERMEQRQERIDAWIELLRRGPQ